MASRKKNPIAKIVSKAGKKEEPVPEQREVQDWLDKIKKAEDVKRQWREKFRVDLAYEYRDGAQRPPEIPDKEWITINKIYSNLKSELPSLYSNDPYFFIKLARSFSPNPMDIALYEQRGKIRQSMLNYLKKELQLKKKARVSILDAYFQFGVHKTHLSADIIENPEAGKPLKDENGADIMSGGQPLLQPEQIPANKKYRITRIHPNDFGFDADASVLEDSWKFLYEIIRLPLDDVKNDKKYEASARESLKATEISADQAEKNRQRRKKGTLTQNELQPSLAVLYEVYDLKKNQWFVVSDGTDKYLSKPSNIPRGTENHPYSFLFLGLPRDDSPYPVPPVSQWLDPQRENNELRSKILTHRKRFNRKYTMWEGAFDDADNAAVKLEIGEDGTILRQSQPGQSIFPIQDAPLDQNHIQELLMLRNDFEELSTGANQQGAGAGVDSATEAGIIEKRVVIREGDNLSLVMDFVTDIGRKLDQLVQGHISRDEAVKVTGPEGEYWELVRAIDYGEIEGEYEYSINAGSTIPQLPEIERAQWMQFLGLIAQAPQLALSRTLLKRTAEMHHIEDETLIDELHNMAKGIMGGSMQMPPQMGSIAGVGDMRSMMQAGRGMSSGISNVRGGRQ